MQATATINSARNAEPFQFRPAAWLRRHADAVRRRIRGRRDLMALAQLDDRLLEDIGLCRGDLPCGLPR